MRRLKDKGIIGDRQEEFEYKQAFKNRLIMDDVLAVGDIPEMEDPTPSQLIEIERNEAKIFKATSFGGIL